ncbi:hypothetical protein AGR56_04380 [Clostridium sp. DMHC 10]|uniref:class I SAM-dependent methyltransferase n=1 Tax=Clostridium sp. DMHC 10 TaxID=747377 RepID=UPI00069F20EB|nr:class I SAM-dependent methyltransferase [Clostridium sp. DMHC 10]KOF56156.1 hypothetical protein AGR56_04380 [Clostridium sp. DMHC 10]
MDSRDFFNNLAFKWDEICNHEPLKLKKIIDLSNIKYNSKIIDIGTGTGIMLDYLMQTNPLKITAIDISENMIAVAKSKYKDNKISFVNDDIFNFKEDGYDYALLYSVYPHFEDKEALFRQISNLLNNNGKIIIAHSESKEKINAVHSLSESVKHDILPSIEITAKIMCKYFKISTIIDNEEMYFIDGIKI